MKILITLAFLLLVGCTAAQRAAYYAPDCEAYGFQKGTVAFSQCLVQMEQTHVQSMTAGIAAGAAVRAAAGQ